MPRPARGAAGGARGPLNGGVTPGPGTGGRWAHVGGRGRRCGGAEDSGPVLPRHPAWVSAPGEGPGPARSPSPSGPLPWGSRTCLWVGALRGRRAGGGPTLDWGHNIFTADTSVLQQRGRGAEAAPAPRWPRGHGRTWPQPGVPGEGHLRRRRGARTRWSLYLRLGGLSVGSLGVGVCGAPSPRLGGYGGDPISRPFRGAPVPSHSWDGDSPVAGRWDPRTARGSRGLAGAELGCGGNEGGRRSAQEFPAAPGEELESSRGLRGTSRADGNRPPHRGPAAGTQGRGPLPGGLLSGAGGPQRGPGFGAEPYKAATGSLRRGQPGVPRGGAGVPNARGAGLGTQSVAAPAAPAPRHRGGREHGKVSDGAACRVPVPEPGSSRMHSTMGCGHPTPGEAPSLQGSRGQPHGRGLQPFCRVARHA